MGDINHFTGAAGRWLALGAGLLVLALIFHGPPSPVLEEQMHHLSEHSGRWTAVHWTASISLSSMAMAGLIMLCSRSDRVDDWKTVSAWALIAVGALWTVTTAVAEATAVSQAAAEGNLEQFTYWWEFSEGKGNGFAALALAVALIAWGETKRPTPLTPGWAAWVATVAGVLSFAGWALGMWLGLGLGGPVWLISSLVMCLWLVWFGLGLARGG